MSCVLEDSKRAESSSSEEKDNCPTAFSDPDYFLTRNIYIFGGRNFSARCNYGSEKNLFLEASIPPNKNKPENRKLKKSPLTAAAQS